MIGAITGAGTRTLSRPFIGLPYGLLQELQNAKRKTSCHDTL